MRVALCGLWHVHAEEYYRRAAALGEVVGVFEENETWRDAFCEKYGVRAFASFQQLLDSNAEGVIVCTATSAHVEVMTRLAAAGKHIFTEKVLALTDEGAAEIETAVRRSGVNFVISLPQKYLARHIAVKQIVDSGELGKVNYFRFRNCHSGSVDNWLPAHFYHAGECGGGAMIDLGAHGMYLTDWICGQPVSCTSVFTRACSEPSGVERNTDGVEDNAITVMGFADGCIAVNETGFVSRRCPAVLEVCGEKGNLWARENSVVKSTAETGYQMVEVELGEDQPGPIDQFLTGQILPGCGMKEARHLTHMMVMAYANQAK